MFGLGMSTYGNLTNASMAYLPFMAYNPFGITNFGGDIQIFPVEPYSQSHIGLAFNQVAQMTGWPAGIYGGYPMTPQINMNAVVAQASAMAAQSFNQLASQDINAALQAIAGQKAKIQAQLQAKDLKAEDKAKLEEQLKKLEEYEKQINDLKTSSKDPQSVYLKANELKVAVNDLIAGKPSTPSTQTSETSSSSASSSSEGSDASDDVSSQGSKVEPKNFTQWVRDMRDAMWGLGTGDNFDAGCDEITSNDVIERMIQWNKLNPKESFMEAFMADASRSQKKTYGKKILNALADKAMELGIDLSQDEDYLKCQKEMDSWFWIDNGVADNYNALIKKIAAKMDYKYEYTPYDMLPK